MIEVSILEIVFFLMWLVTTALWAKALHRAHMAETIVRAMMENKEMRDRLVASYERTFGATE